MADAAADVLGPRIQGGVVAAVAAADVRPPLETIVGQHPQPGDGSVAAGRRALAIARTAPADADLFVLISGGASSLLVAPAGGLELEDKRATTGVLLRSGADIHALNTVRKHLSAIKGGRLAAAAAATTRAFVLSDVVGDVLSAIASGPTVADPSTYADALGILERYGGLDAYPPRVVAHLAAGVRGEQPESPKPGDPRLARASTALIGGRANAMRGAAAEAERQGYEVLVLDDAVVGDARVAGPRLVRAMLEKAGTVRRPTCVIASGETTVRVTGHGVGGRNQEMVLAAADVLREIGTPILFASIGTDGIDGPTDAAGAVADRTTTARAAAAGLAPPREFLDDNNSHAFFAALDDLIRTGPTGTNVGDLQIFLLA
jgi:hydroxypyruvate reductase